MRKIVLAILETDRFPEDVASRAAWIAQHYGADLELVYSDPTLGFLRDSFMISADSQQIAETIRQAQAEELERLAESVAASGVEITTSMINDRPASDAIVAKALDCEPLLVVKGTAYHSPAERATFTFTDWQLIRKLDYPLWLVKPHEWSEKPTIVAAVDPMHQHDEEGVLDQAIVDTGKELATKCDGNLLLLHTYEHLSQLGDTAKFRFKSGTLPVDEIEEKNRAEHSRHLDAFASKNEIAPDALHQLPGRTRDVLPMFARANAADLVVMGAMARTGLKRRILGSTAELVLDHLPCDILIVRRPD